jgi:hypothetical protein
VKGKVFDPKKKFMNRFFYEPKLEKWMYNCGYKNGVNIKVFEPKNIFNQKDLKKI